MHNDTSLKNGISVIMPTFKRLHDLPRALDSLLAQEDIDLPFEIIISDNDPLGSARDLIESYARKSKRPIVYVHSPNPGVSNARNTAIAKARGRYIAWLDDDQEAAPNWLSELLGTAREHYADLVFCPSPPVMEVNTPLDAQYIKFFDRKAPETDGVINCFYGCGNSFMDRKRITLPTPVFDPIANESGGEDDMLFSHLQSKGATIAWTSNTFAYEHVPESRATPSYVRKRSFAWGQGPTEIAYDQKDYLAIIKWMIIGAGQMAVYSVPLAATFISRSPNYIHWLSKTYQGFGKLFWHRGLRPKLYGQAGAANKAAADARRAKMQAQS